MLFDVVATDSRHSHRYDWIVVFGAIDLILVDRHDVGVALQLFLHHLHLGRQRLFPPIEAQPESTMAAEIREAAMIPFSLTTYFSISHIEFRSIKLARIPG